VGFWAVEITGTDPAGPTAVTYRFAQGRGRAPTDAAHIPGGLVRWASPSQKIDVGSTGGVRSTADGGELVVTNKALAHVLAGTWDDLAGYAWQDRTAALYWVSGTTWASKTLVAQALLEQPVADMKTLRWPLKDPRAALDAPLQTSVYAGDNVLPAGVEGGEDLKGKPLPLGYGVFSNVTPDEVNASKLIYRLTANVSTPLCVRDGGVPLTAGTLRANQASMEANAPAAGTYDYTSNSTDGTLIRLGSGWVFGIKCDGQEGATSADRTHAQIWKRIRTELCGNVAGDIAAASVTAVDTADANEVGFYFNDGQTRRQALDEVLASLVGYEVLDLNGQWNIGRLANPSGSPSISLVLALGTDVQTTSDRALITVERTRPAWQPDGSPPFRVNVRCGKNNTVMGPSEFAGSASPRLKQKFSTEWRVETATDTSIWDPSDDSGDFPHAPELTFDTGYQPGADNRTFPHAATRASELLTLFSALKGQYVVSFLPEPGDAILPGAVVKLTYARYGMSGGPLFRVLQSSWVVEAGRDPKASLLIGLQT
jgi:hypothetical protein